MSDILFLAHRVPFPPDRGDKIRSWHLFKAMTAIAPTHVCAVADRDEEFDHLAGVAPLAVSTSLEWRSHSVPGAMLAALLKGSAASVEAFASPKLAARVTRLLADHPINTIYAFSSQMAQFVPRDFAGRFVMDFVDVDSAKFEAYGGFGNRLEAKRLRRWEQMMAGRADLNLFVSEAEAALFRHRSGLGADCVQALENGIDLDHFTPRRATAPVDATGHPLIVFTGQMNYPPNAEAVALFVRDALPAIRAIHPNACFAIVGREPNGTVRRLALKQGVQVTGEVADTRDWLAAADVVVAPLKLARGIQNKVLEAMAMAKPVVASPAAAEGIDANPGEHLLVAEGAGAVLALLGDRVRATALGHAARLRMEERYSWSARLARLPDILGVPR